MTLDEWILCLDNDEADRLTQVESLLIWLASGEKDEDGNWLDDNDTQND